MTATPNTEKATVDHDAIAATFQASVMTALADPTDENMVLVANAYQAIHPGKRAGVQASVMTAALGVDGVDVVSIGRVATTISNASDLATSTRRTVEIDPRHTLAEQVYALRTVASDLIHGLPNEDLDYVLGILAMVNEDLDLGRQADATTATLRTAIQATATRPTSTTRTTIEGTIADLVTAGRLTVGQVLVGGAENTYKATVTADGLKVAGKNYGSPSAAATAAGVTAKATNGWKFWNVLNGTTRTPIADLRNP